MKKGSGPTALLIYAVGSLLDFSSTYLCLLLVPGAYETNPLVARVVFTPLHPLLEVLSASVMYALCLVGLLVEAMNVKSGHERLGVAARLAIHSAVAGAGAFRLAAAIRNILLFLAARG